MMTYQPIGTFLAQGGYSLQISLPVSDQGLVTGGKLQIFNPDTGESRFVRQSHTKVLHHLGLGAGSYRKVPISHVLSAAEKMQDILLRPTLYSAWDSEIEKIEQTAQKNGLQLNFKEIHRKIEKDKIYLRELRGFFREGAQSAKRKTNIDEINEESLQQHIAYPHLTSYYLCHGIWGVPRYDIEMAHSLGFSLKRIIQYIFELLEASDKDLVEKIKEEEPETGVCSINKILLMSYRVALIKVLLYIETVYGENTIDWQRVEKAYPTYRNISCDIEKDSIDLPFE